MSCCSSRCMLITVCILQLVAIIERQVFDFLGYMWAPIIGNFLQIIFVIIGLFGAVQYRPKVVVVYTLWCLIWLGWNIFVICFYLEVGILTREGDVLNIGTGNKSWWLEHGYGCKVTNDTWTEHSDRSSSETVRVSPPEDAVSDCLLQYYHVEIIHAGVQIFLALLGLCASCIVIYVFTEEDDSSQPVHGELEYIKMRYRSPARHSFREKSRPGGAAANKKINKAYDTITTQTSTFSSHVPGGETTRDQDGNLVAVNYNSDDSIDRVPVVVNNAAVDKDPSAAVTVGDVDIARVTPSSSRRANVTTSSNTNIDGGGGGGGVDNAENIDRPWARNSPHLGRDSPRNSPNPGRGRDYTVGGDLGYESYDSRSHLVVGKESGQTII